ncbi:hypothetical protein DY000_02039767 [Brassica cretica]|uniref:Uncharacterized protein n=1 Tax=Brassica cretica TaxID=69181 RepID=A0ABQ7BPD7_BRACR|nr:hypothetical protein DY000_02039767 [Brassica cretica]
MGSLCCDLKLDHHAVEAQAWITDICRESFCLVPLPIEFACNWWWWRRWDDQVLEHSHWSLLELSKHRIPSVFFVVVEQERKRVA